MSLRVEDRPSFSEEVKSELANVQPGRPCCREAELHSIVAALAEPSGKFDTPGKPGGRELVVRVPRNAVARKIIQLARATGGTVTEVTKGRTEKRPSYRLRLTLPAGHGSIDSCCARATLRGAFLARGVLGNPADAYHLEMVLPLGDQGAVLTAAQRAGIPVAIGSRRGHTIVYLKGAEPISRLLGLMGANRGVMRFENDRILRDMRSQANRRVNGETANLDKRLRAALKQVYAIRQLKQRDPRLAGLPTALRDVALLRLEHPQAGLLELAGHANLSKSAVANRLRRLLERANS
ncbi:MAG: DNA-binding protein WhiA [Candidatus Dormibacteria bacterium]